MSLRHRQIEQKQREEVRMKQEGAHTYATRQSDEANNHWLTRVCIGIRDRDLDLAALALVDLGRYELRSETDGAAGVVIWLQGVVIDRDRISESSATLELHLTNNVRDSQSNK